MEILLLNHYKSIWIELSFVEEFRYLHQVETNGYHLLGGAQVPGVPRSNPWINHALSIPI